MKARQRIFLIIGCVFLFTACANQQQPSDAFTSPSDVLTNPKVGTGASSNNPTRSQADISDAYDVCGPDIVIAKGALSEIICLRMPAEEVLEAFSVMGVQLNKYHDEYYYSRDYNISFKHLMSLDGTYYLGLSGFHSSTYVDIEPSMGELAERLVEKYGSYGEISYPEAGDTVYYSYNHGKYDETFHAEMKNENDYFITGWGVYLTLSDNIAEVAVSSGGELLAKTNNHREIVIDKGMTYDSLISALEQSGMEYSAYSYGSTMYAGFSGINVCFLSENQMLDYYTVISCNVISDTGLELGLSYEDVTSIYGESEKFYTVDGKYVLEYIVADATLRVGFDEQSNQVEHYTYMFY